MNVAQSSSPNLSVEPVSQTFCMPVDAQGLTRDGLGRFRAQEGDECGDFFGLDEDSHYIIAPPGIPLIYSYFIFAFSIPGMYFLFKKKRKENLFLTCWLLFFILVYSLVIIVRIKNMLLLIPPFMILSVLGARFFSTYLYRTSHKWLPLNLYFKLILKNRGYYAKTSSYYYRLRIPR